MGKGKLVSRLRVVIDLFIIIWVFVGALNALLFLGLLSQPTSPARRLLNITTLFNIPAGFCESDGIIQQHNPQDLVETKLLAFVNFRPAGRLGLLGIAGGYFVLWGLYFTILRQLRAVFDSLTSGQPFLRPNVGRLRVIGWTIIAAGLFRHVFKWTIVLGIRSVLTLGNAPPTVPWAFVIDDLNLEAFFVGAAILVLAEIFRAGAALQEEQSLTI